MLKKKEKRHLLNITNGCMIFDHNLAAYTSFLIGGTADAVAFPNSCEEITKIGINVLNMDIPLTVLGGGSNTLIKDRGIRGVVMILSNRKNILFPIKKVGNLRIIKVPSRIKLQNVCNFAIRNDLLGTNFALGIPGTIGGAIATNAGTPRGSISDIVQSITILDKNSKIEKLIKPSKSSTYKGWFQNENSDIILGCEIELIKGDSNYIRQEAKHYVVKRINTQPRFLANAGCFFKNPKINLSAGELIDKVGLKGKQIGGATISKKHANFIVNYNKATASDVLKLADLARELVFKYFQIVLEPEVCILGD